eukprot:5335409-Amphidinium_carterae.1
MATLAYANQVDPRKQIETCWLSSMCCPVNKLQGQKKQTTPDDHKFAKPLRVQFSRGCQTWMQPLQIVGSWMESMTVVIIRIVVYTQDVPVNSAPLEVASRTGPLMPEPKTFASQCVLATNECPSNASFRL